MKKGKQNNKDTKIIAQFLYEVGTLRKVVRAHRQTLLGAFRFIGSYTRAARYGLTTSTATSA